MDLPDDIAPDSAEELFEIFGVDAPVDRKRIALRAQGLPMVECFRQTGSADGPNLRSVASKWFATKRAQRALKAYKAWIGRATAEDLSDAEVSRIIDTGIRTQTGAAQAKLIELRDKRQDRLQAIRQQEDSNPVALFRKIVAQSPGMSDEWFMEMARSLSLSPERLLCKTECDQRADGDQRGCTCRKFRADFESEDDDDAYRQALSRLRPSPSGDGKPGNGSRSPRPGGGNAVAACTDGSSAGANGKAPESENGTASPDQSTLRDDAVKEAEAS